MIKFLPQKTLGKWTVGLIICFFVGLVIFYLFILSGERGGATFFSNLKLTIPILSGAICAMAAFFVGLVAIIKQKERSILTFLSMLIGLLVFLWSFAEIAFPL